MPVIGGATIAVYADFYSCWAIGWTEIGHHVVEFTSVCQLISTFCNFTNTTYWIRIAFICYRNIFFIARILCWSICLLRCILRRVLICDILVQARRIDWAWVGNVNVRCWSINLAIFCRIGCNSDRWGVS